MYVMTLTNRRRSALVGEAAARLGGDVPAVDLDAGGRQEEHAGRDPLDGPVEAEDQPGGEVHYFRISFISLRGVRFCTKENVPDKLRFSLWFNTLNCAYCWLFR